jgi:hypothetical protein
MIPGFTKLKMTAKNMKDSGVVTVLDCLKFTGRVDDV